MVFYRQCANFYLTVYHVFYTFKPCVYESLAQSVEQLPFKQWVRSSILRRLKENCEKLLTNVRNFL